MENLIEVVGTMFFRNGKLLIDKPRSKPTFQMIGGKVEKGETSRQAAIRECHEELGENAIYYQKFPMVEITKISQTKLSFVTKKESKT